MAFRVIGDPLCLDADLAHASPAGPAPTMIASRLRNKPSLGERYFPHTSLATSTASFSFAHCSSSVSRLPSSVEAKPHCGDSAS